MQKIKLTSRISGIIGNPGEVVSVSRFVARALVSSGRAEYWPCHPAAQTAPTSEPETAPASETPVEPAEDITSEAKPTEGTDGDANDPERETATTKPRSRKRRTT